MTKIRVDIYDPTIDDQFNKDFYQNTDGVLIVFDVSNLNSFYNSEIREIIQMIKEETEAEFILIGNKSDLTTPEDLIIIIEDIKKFQEEYNISEFITTSAKTGKNIHNTFDKIIDCIISKKFKKNMEVSSIKLMIIGLKQVGKTSIVNNYTGAIFTENYFPTMGFSIKSKEIEYYKEEKSEIIGEGEPIQKEVEFGKTQTILDKEEILTSEDQRDVFEKQQNIFEEKDREKRREQEDHIRGFQEREFERRKKKDLVDFKMEEKTTLPKMKKIREPMEEMKAKKKAKKISEEPMEEMKAKKKAKKISEEPMKYISKIEPNSQLKREIMSIEEETSEDVIEDLSSTKTSSKEEDKLSGAVTGYSSTLAKPMVETRVQKKLIRKATVFYKKRMNPMKLNKMTVFLSTSEIYEELKIEFEKIARAATGKALEIKEDESIVRIEPLIPGCICVPSFGYLDAKKEYDHLNFVISPLTVGEINDAKVNIYYKDELIDSIPTPIKIVNTAIAKISAVITIIIPILGKLFDEMFNNVLMDIIPYYNNIGGLEGVLTILTTIMLLISGITYYFRKPKDAKPVESKSLPEILNAIEQ